MPRNRTETFPRIISLGPASLPTQSDVSAAISLLDNPSAQHHSQIEDRTGTTNSAYRKFAAIFGLDAWFYEILALLSTAASFMTLIVVFSRYDGKPNPRWRTGMTLNVFVSFVSAIFRMSIMLPVEQCISQATWISLSREPRPLDEVVHYDSASRGPWGSLLLLVRLRSRYFACIGAAITIIAVAIGPFFQGAVEYTSKPVENPTSVAAATTAQTWDGNIGLAGGGEYNTMCLSLPPYIRSSMYSGLLSSPMVSLPDPPYYCPSGNCTWDPFATLAIGTQCVDFDSYIRISCRPSNITLPLNGVEYTGDDCEFSATSDDDIYTKKFLSGTNNQTLMKIGTGNVVITPQVVASQFGPLDIGDKNGGLTLVQWVKAKDNIYEPADSHLESFLQQNTTFEARRCILYAYVHVLSVQVASGNYSEQSLNEIVHADSAPTNVFGPDDKGIEFHLNGDAVSHGVLANLTLPQQNWAMLMCELREKMFNDSIVSAGQGPSTNGELVPRMLYAADNTTQSLTNMAHYLSVALRANDTILLQERTGDASAIAPSQAVNGTVWVQEIFVRVRWKFLILPATVLVLSAGFLAVTIVKSRSERIGLWKSNPLTLLLHAREDRTPMSMHTSNAVEATAAGMEVHIVMGENQGHVAKIG